ncbi:sugar phosphate isomerase/epimerase family protein [Aquibacillus albus]|uniref:Sugar phosphate isomerase/epimerase n=1 Tax=Aquibacillus albus TaxID=1168171 RepID=A0ABS2N3J5_9BACI|nr:sugar phosphate isomerase/epimerase [Aquibacillus albus]MBM7572673.1 sugar phosphate isomerase/epimerase [Aquibacillus albus]
MKLGLRIPDIKNLSLEEKVDLAVECRLDAIELSASELMDHDITRRLKEYAEKRNITITSAGIGIDLCNPQSRDEVRENMKLILEGAKILGGIPLFSRTMVADEGVGQEETWKNVIEFTREITEICASENITFSIEIDHSPCFVHNLERFEKLYKKVNHVNLHLNFDPTNLLVNGSDPFESIEKWGHLFTGGHIKDGVFRTDKRSEVPLGQGEVDYLNIFKALEQRGIDLTFQFEHLQHPDEVKQAATYMHGLLGK